MHMADALISPAVGVAMWTVSGGIIAYSAKKVREGADDRKVPLMGVLGAFIFGAQMVNFAIPGTGSSGHLGGGMILSVLLGPYAAFLTLASVLTIQALFFADGGLLALGCNMLNMGFFTCFLAYPVIYKRIVGDSTDRKLIMLAAILAGVAGLQLGAFGVVLQTMASGISELPFKTFLLLMQPIHLAIGLVEGLVTAGIITLVMNARPEILASAKRGAPISVSVKKTALWLGASAVLVAGTLSWFASADPDGLEWSMSKTSGKEELESGGRLHGLLGCVQKRTAVFPDYNFRKADAADPKPAPAWPAVDTGTSAAGLIGGFFTLLLTGIVGMALRRRGTPAS